MSSDLDTPQALFGNVALRQLAEAPQAKTSRFFLGLVEFPVTALSCTCRCFAELRQEGRTFRTRAVSARGNTIGDLDPEPSYALRNGAKRRGRTPPGRPLQLFPENQVNHGLRLSLVVRGSLGERLGHLCGHPCGLL